MNQDEPADRVIKIETEHYCLVADPASWLILLIWKKQTTGHDFRQAYLTGMKLVMQHDLKYWLTDSRKTHYLEMADQNWLVERLIPRFLTSPLRKFGRLVQPDSISIYDSLNAEERATKRYQLPTELQNEVFLDRGLALHWILEELQDTPDYRPTYSWWHLPE